VPLHELWFYLIAVLFLGFLVLEGFDFGVGMLMAPLGSSGEGDPDDRRRAVLNTIGPVWDANEVWLITAGAAMFAAFPNWYATLFSALYLPLLAILFGMILRIVGIALIILGAVLMRQSESKPSAAAEVETQDEKFRPQYAEGYFFALLCAAGYGVTPVLVRAAIGNGGPGAAVAAGVVSYGAASVLLLLILLWPGLFRHAVATSREMESPDARILLLRVAMSGSPISS